jgi:NADPH:quinone reductase-like Zn-dependent oxidoreductase
VIGTASGANLEGARDLGADELLDHSADRFADGFEGVDLVFDTVGGQLLARSPGLVRRGGRIVSVAEEPADGSDAVYFVVEPKREQLIELGRLIDAGDLLPAIDSVFPLAAAPAAFARTAANQKRGKVVLRVAESRDRV